MPAFALIGNCQLESIAFLIEHMLPDSDVRIFDFSAMGLQREENRRAFRESLARADYVLVQPNNDGFLGHALLKRELPDQCFVITNLYFRGLHPDACYLGTLEDRFKEPSLYHSVAVLDAFKRGVSEKKAAACFSSENFTRLGLFEAWESSLDEMRKRDAVSDLGAAGLIENYCSEFPGFLTVNHPTIHLMSIYITAVLAQMGIAPKPLPAAALRDPLTLHDVLPVHDCVAAVYELPYRTTQHWMIEHMGRRFVDRAEYVALCYAAYRKADAKKLAVHSPLDLRESLQKNPALAHLV